MARRVYRCGVCVHEKERERETVDGMLNSMKCQQNIIYRVVTGKY